MLLGDGSDFDDLKKLYGNISNIMMTGSVSNVNEYLQASDIYISSSKSEGLPNGVLEAMAVGLPVILSNIEQHKEIYDANKAIGELYQIGDKNDCLNKLLSMDKSKIIYCGQQAYKCAHSQFSAKRMSKEYQEEYLNVYKKMQNLQNYKD